MPSHDLRTCVWRCWTAFRTGFWAVGYCGRIMDKLQHTEDHAAIETVVFSVWIGFEEGEKVMATVYRDASAIIYINYLRNRRTVNAKYYASLRVCSLKYWRINTFLVTMMKFSDLGYELLSHLSYFQDFIASG